MMDARYRIKRTLPILMAGLLSIAIAGPLMAQNKEKEYFDSFGLQGSVTYRGDWPGEAQFPEKGPYTLKWRILQSDTLRTFLAKGTLRDELPHGKWSWQQADWNFSVEPGSGIEPRFATEGEEQWWEGHFTDGQASGLWTYRLSTRTPQQAGRSTAAANRRNAHRLEVKSAFKEGRMNGSWSIRDSNPEKPVRIDGACNEHGEAHGKWVYRYERYGEPYKEERTYRNGLLMAVMRHNSTDTIVVNLHERQRIVEALTEQGMADSIPYIVIGEQAFTAEEVPCEATFLLNHYMYDHFLDGWQLEAFPHRFERSGPLFRRLQYLITPDELALRDSIQARAEEIRQAIASTFEGRNPDIARARNADMDLAIGALKATLKRLDIVEGFMEGSAEEDFLYAERNHGGLEGHFIAINAHGHFAGTSYPDVMAALPAIDMMSDSLLYFNALFDVLGRTQQYIAPHLSTAEATFTRMRKQGELSALEESMLENMNTLDSLYKGQGLLAGVVTERWIEGYMQERIRAYAQNDDYHNGLAMAGEILTEMDSLKAWAPDWMRLELLDKELDAAYTYNAYNPYTGESDIPLSVKNRFRRQVIAVLLPYQRNLLEEAESWEDFVERHQQFMHLRKELIRFAFLDGRADRRIERRIRQEDRPEKMLQVFMGHMER